MTRRCSNKFSSFKRTSKLSEAIRINFKNYKNVNQYFSREILTKTEKT
jgi:hypothetical protein